MTHLRLDGSLASVCSASLSISPLARCARSAMGCGLRNATDAPPRTKKLSHWRRPRRCSHLRALHPRLADVRRRECLWQISRFFGIPKTDDPGISHHVLYISSTSGGQPEPWLGPQNPSPCARGPGAFVHTAGQGSWVWSLRALANGTAWADFCLVYHHHQPSAGCRSNPPARGGAHPDSKHASQWQAGQ